jgi:prevent-host-death family protein
LTIDVHVCTFLSMTHKTSASHLKARMGQYMRAVRAGEEVVVTDRDQPVAKLVPFRGAASAARDELPIVQPKDPGAPALGKVQLHPVRYRGRSTTDLLLEDRRRR